jgi:hypothetical protein
LSKLYTGGQVSETKIIIVIASNCDVFSFLEETVKGKWKNLRDTFKKELKKVRKYRSGDEAEAFRYTGSWCHFEAMQFLKRIATPRETEGNLPASQEENCDFQDSQEDESQEYEAQDSQERMSQHQEAEQEELAQQNEEFGPSTSKGKSKMSRLQKELQHLEESLPAANSPTKPIAVAVSRKRKLNKVSQQEGNFEREMLLLETKKLELLKNSNNDDEDLNFFKSLLPHVKQLPSINKLNFRTKVQNLLCQELTKLESLHNRIHLSQTSTTSRVTSPYCSPLSSIYSSGQQSDGGHNEVHNNYIVHEFN